MVFNEGAWISMEWFASRKELMILVDAFQEGRHTCLKVACKDSSPTLTNMSRVLLGELLVKASERQRSHTGGTNW